MSNLEIIKSKIHEIRGQKVMLDYDLALLYETETKRLKEAVRRNAERFPEDFMFELTKTEYENLRTQFASSSHGGLRYMPFAFTEQGIAMLSSVLKSDLAIQINIQIMRTFTQLRQMLSSHKELREKIEKLEKKYDVQFEIIFKTIRDILAEEEKPKRKLGF